MGTHILRQLDFAAKGFLAFLPLIYVGCSSSPVESAVANVCVSEDASLVRTRGYLRLPMATDVILREPVPAEERRKLIVVEKPNGTGAFVTAFVTSTDRGEPNRVGVMPASYTYNDLHVYSNAGKVISPDEPVLVTGRVKKSAANCTLDVEEIEIP